MSFVQKGISGLVGSITGSTKAADAARDGAGITAAGQRDALAYLKETEALPQELRKGALGIRGGLFGLGDMTQPAAMSAITNSADYQNVLKSREAGEEAILRNAGATGGLRSGNVNQALAGFNIGLEQDAYQAALQGLSGLAQLPSNANQIAGLTASIGQTLGQGRIAEGQAVQAGRGLALSAAVNGAGAFAAGGGFGGFGGGGGGSLGSGISSGGLSQGGSVYGGSALGSGISFSDTRLKENIKPAGKRNGHHWYTWQWSKEANGLGLFGDDEGVMAHEIADTMPEAIKVQNGYLTVDYSALGVQ